MELFKETEHPCTIRQNITLFTYYLNGALSKIKGSIKNICRVKESHS